MCGADVCGVGNGGGEGHLGSLREQLRPRRCCAHVYMSNREERVVVCALLPFASGVSIWCLGFRCAFWSACTNGGRAWCCQRKWSIRAPHFGGSVPPASGNVGVPAAFLYTRYSNLDDNPSRCFLCFSFKKVFVCVCVGGDMLGSSQGACSSNCSA